MAQPWGGARELRLNLRDVPLDCATLDVFNLFREFGHIIRIEFYEPRECGRDGYIVFRPPPREEDTSWLLTKGLTISQNQFNTRIIRCSVNRNLNHREPMRDPDTMTVQLKQLDIGVMTNDNQMLVLHSTNSNEPGYSSMELVVDTRRKTFDIYFDLRVSSGSTKQAGSRIKRYKISIGISQLGHLFQSRESNGDGSLVTTLQMPPLLFERVEKPSQNTREGRVWSKSQSWVRLTGIDAIRGLKDSPTQLQRPNPVLDVGRCLTYRLVRGEVNGDLSAYNAMLKILHGHNIQTISKHIDCISAQPKDLWQIDDDHVKAPTGSSLNALRSMESSVHLSFQARYQLEVCISQGILHECNIDTAFLRRLSQMEEEETKIVGVDEMKRRATKNQFSKATRLLEMAASLKHRVYEPTDIFKLQSKLSVKRNKLPHHFVMVRSVTVTPTTMYITTPVMETSNRVIRKYSVHQDRFIRVRFTDEKYKGRIWPVDPLEDSREEVFNRVTHTMKNGIKIGGIHYDFLAFGNSQFREHGAYFFAPTSDVTAQDIRNWMGNFKDIRVVAKHASRIGQCFSTTRATLIKAELRRIPDIERNGFCFTDGVGQISPFLAQMITKELQLPFADYPSVFQFRLGGCKGVLAVNPDLKGGSFIEIRPSQEKFTADYHGLEVCKTSQFSSAHLNMQIILVLSALGVPDQVFLTKMESALADLEHAMSDENKAVEALTRNVDLNQTSITLAAMVSDGFMGCKEPFMMSCLNLWRSWTIKYLKEKAKIFVDAGAFVFGCVDETGTLRGHATSKRDNLVDIDAGPQRKSTDNGPVHNPEDLPEIFIQVPDPEFKGKHRIIQGVCTLARNPSLHPGDIRVVKAVDNPKLHHLKDCVVLPQTGERDLANMCSGGDLDGDDFLVMWDETLLPNEWHHEPMNYQAVDPKISDGPVTAKDITDFFVDHMKNDNLGRIAVAHRYWADLEPDGVKSRKCQELAQLHSMAVDYAKTGVAATMPQHLRVKQWPHWSEPKNKRPDQIYRSKKILGQLYDHVEREPFRPMWDTVFDERILKAYELDSQILSDAREVKQQYDDAIRRIMQQRGIQSEFEVWTTFALKHNNETGDYKFAEVMGELVATLKDHHQDLCYEKAGTNSKDRDWSKIGPFIAAMYKVTAEDVKDAVSRAQSLAAEIDPETMPLMSFPWIFHRELGQIATGRTYGTSLAPRPGFGEKKKQKAAIDLLGGGEMNPLPNLPELILDSRPVLAGEELNVTHHGDNAYPDLFNFESLQLRANNESSESSTPQTGAIESSPRQLPSDGLSQLSRSSTSTPPYEEAYTWRSEETVRQASNFMASSGSHGLVLNGNGGGEGETDNDDNDQEILGEEPVTMYNQNSKSSALSELERLLAG